MPASLVHFAFIKENIDNKDKYFMETALGGQGPDVFFFYGYSLSKRENKHPIRYFGTYLHHIDIAEVYFKLIDYANKSQDKEVLLAYIRGLLMHYILDRNVHPYIFYRSGFVSSGSKEDEFNNLLSHAYFESGLDKIYSTRHKTLQNPKKCVKIPNSSLVAITRMWYWIAKEMKYEGIEPDTFIDCYEDMRFALGALSSPLKIKKFFFHLIKRNTLVDALSFPFTNKKAIKEDYLNTSKREWKNCVTGDSRNESVDELVANAVAETREIDTLLNEPSSKKMKTFIHEIDHDGFKVGATKKYFDK